MKKLSLALFLFASVALAQTPYTPLRIAVVYSATAAAVAGQACTVGVSPDVFANDTGNIYYCTGTYGLAPFPETDYDLTNDGQVLDYWPAGTPAIFRVNSGGTYYWQSSQSSSTGTVTMSAKTAGARWVFDAPGSSGTILQVTGNLNATGTVTGSTLSGTNTGDQTITLTGNVTGTGTGSFAATIANDAVTYAKMQNVSATDKVLGRATAGAGDTEELACDSTCRDLLDDTSAAQRRTTLNIKYALPIGFWVAGAGLNPVDATTYFFGTPNRVATTSSQLSKLYFRQGGIVRIAELYLLTSVANAGSNESFTAYVRLNDTTDYSIASVATTDAQRVFTNTAIDITISPGDYIEIKVVCPTWATNPTTWGASGYLLVE